jgi:Gas vesicle synthesis protein GvpL/GvpF
MSYLLYCIVHEDHPGPRPEPRFLGYPRASIMARAAGLGAVVSKLSAVDRAPDVARLLVYARIVESFNRERTVIPMRYGCRFEDLGEISRLLEQHRDRYLRLLDEVDGRVELSVRATVSNPATPPHAAVSARPLIRLSPRAAGPGAAYLAERRRFYAFREELEKRRDEMSKGICARAQGTFVRCTSECTTRDGEEILSMHFLVPRASVELFASKLHPPGPSPEISLLVTGPWPPYNFVCPRVSPAVN